MKVRQRRKLYNLGYYHCDGSGESSHDPDRVIHNYSSYQLSEVEKKLLAKGLNFCLPLNTADYLAPFELLFRQVKDDDLSKQTLDILKIDIKKIAFKSLKDYSPLKALNLSVEEYEALKGLSSRKDLVIQKSDKGNSVVILDKSDYLNKMSELISDESKFVNVPVGKDKDYNFMIKETDKVCEFLDKLVAKQSLSSKVADDLKPKGPSPARLYGLAKIHKALVNGLPKFRPIISQISSPTYKLAKYLVSIIRPVTTNEYTLKDSFEFSSIIDKQNHRFYMASLDVDSLFTNVPLDETIDIIAYNLYKRKKVLNGISKTDFKDMLRLTTKGSVFYFNGNYYRQLDGVAMGSPLGPLFANAFLCHYEKEWLNQCPHNITPMFYKRYVDDIFVLLKSSDHLNAFVNYMNSRHVNMTFTFENEVDGIMSFLDIKVYRDCNGFLTSIHRKQTFSGVYSNFVSFRLM